MQPKKLLFVLFATVLVLSGCLPSPYYQKQYNIPKNAWHNDYKPTFKFEVTDTTAPYHLYFIIRHTDAYPYSNIWVWVNTKQPGDTTYERARIEIPLTDQSGKWFGRGMGELWEQRMPITRNDQPMRFNKMGTYEIQFEQNMRINPLPEVLNIGLRVEKDTKRNFSTQ